MGREDWMLAEYSSLRDELRSNRQYVFERPLLILGSTIAAAFVLPEGMATLFIAIPFLVVLLFNLWFTFNRLESSARILAYIQVVLEGEYADSWIGWERSLSAYRWWRHQARRLGVTTKPERPISGLGKDRLRFYPPIFRFHLVLAVLAFLAPALYVLATRTVAHREAPATQIAGDAALVLPLANVLLGVILALMLVVVVVAFARYHPSRLTDIWQEKIMWMVVFDSRDWLLEQENESLRRQAGEMGQKSPEVSIETSAG